MMEDHEFCDSCEGCRPAILDMQTRRPMPQDDPRMIAVNKMWDNETTYAQRRAFIEVTLKNSREPRTFELFQQVCEMIEKAMKSVGE